MWEWIRYRALILAVFGGLALMGSAGIIQSLRF